MASKAILARSVPQPQGMNVIDHGIHEYGYRVLARVVGGSEEYWRVLPSGVIALYVWYSKGHLIAHYRHRAGRITA